jgi:NAD-dependent dihydropyrimidine dehydrogenase PreA subunit
MAKRITVVISQGQSANPVKRELEEALVGALLMERGVDVTVVPHLYDLAPGSTGMLCLEGIAGDMIILSWLFPRGAHWSLDRNGIKGHFGETLLKSESDDDEDDDEIENAATEEADGKDRVGPREIPNRKIYHLRLAMFDKPEPYVEEIRRIVAEGNVQTVDLLGWIGGTPKPEQMERFMNPAPGNVNGNGAAAPAGEPSQHGTHVPDVRATHDGAPAEPVRIEEVPSRRWYPVIDYSRCTNCMECIDFCLFGVYGVDGAETILVEQPDNCRKGCPACSRVCPENAIIFPQHKSPAIAGSPDENAGGLKIDLSQLFGAPNAIEVAALERDTELVAAGRDAVGLSVGIPKRQAGKPQEPKDELDDLMDQLDDLDL